MTLDPDIVPRSRVTRAVVLEPATLRAADDSSEGRTLIGHFAVFDEMTEIRSIWEGEFREQIVPGAFRKTMKDRRSQIRCIYADGRDAMFGSKPIGTPKILEEDRVGARYEVELYSNEQIDGWLVPAARDGQLGASFAFDVVRESWDLEPDDEGLPIRTIEELRLYEFGPCPFPAYEDATAGVRSVVESWSALPDDRRVELARMLSEPPTISDRTVEIAGDEEPEGSSDDLHDPATLQTAIREREFALAGIARPERETS